MVYSYDVSIAAVNRSYFRN